MTLVSKFYEIHPRDWSEEQRSIGQNKETKQACRVYWRRDSTTKEWQDLRLELQARGVRRIGWRCSLRDEAERSEGSRRWLRLPADRIAARPAAKRIAAWPAA
ncbi:hypothetical protein BHM03_00017373 [Ensete ventricosum]|nr:hypothetical protein BHM03_00017373 [Ensete ventricosum]